MKANSVVFALWSVIGMAAGQDPAFSVRMYNYAGVPQEVLEKATREGQRVLARPSTRYTHQGRRASPGPEAR
jgi:hypothetical protein